jgi:asparagine synthase (glutamine-hydrolysing)
VWLAKCLSLSALRISVRPCQLFFFFFAAGVIPLYYGRGMDGSLWFASEMKALTDVCVTLEEFPPGHYYSSSGGLQRYFEPAWWNGDSLPTGELDLVALRTSLEEAVVKRMMCDVPFGVLLSGGLDSSLVASIVCRHASKRVESQETTKAWWPTVHSFSIGLTGTRSPYVCTCVCLFVWATRNVSHLRPSHMILLSSLHSSPLLFAVLHSLISLSLHFCADSPDLANARDVAKFLGTVHHEWVFTIEEGIDALEDVIWHLETYDVTTIRASTPMYLLSRRIKAMGVKMVLSGGR